MKGVLLHYTKNADGAEKSFWTQEMKEKML